ncbi:MAG TPA: reverse transcriptase family protein [Gemmataceae bacterium]|nr:reverse transcriptase family protein [Gemmataceae bacterium]
MSSTQPAPAWLLLPLPANADHDTELLDRVEQLCSKLPDNLPQLQKALDAVKPLASYEPAVNRVNMLIWEQIDALLVALPKQRIGLIKYAQEHMPQRVLARILRRMAKDPDVEVRTTVRKTIRKAKLHEVALPQTQRDGKGWKPVGDWDATGWLLSPDKAKVTRHKTGKRVQEKNGVPVVTTLEQLRKLLGIKSPNQLGYFLLASDFKDGPYQTYTIPKRDGSDRKICAPKKQLKWVQRQILRHILSKVAPHPAAHGFVNGRSTVSNAGPHVGHELVVKFDLKDFFPTMHYFRVMGLFASLGYPTGNCMFGTEDESNQIAPVLARLCCYTPKPNEWGAATLPQGAPTSPAISNLVCRRLDARLEGLAKRNGGVYTRYADDLTFSFPKAEGLTLGRFRWWVDQVCQQEGFTINQEKFRVIRDSQRQVVTGIVVNEALRIPRELRRKYRAILHNCEKNGVEAEARGNPRFKQYLRGFAAYLHMVQPDHGAALLRRVNELLGGKPDDEAPDAEGGARP